MDLTPMTELEAVNIMLGTVMEEPVTSIEESGVSEAAMAYQILVETSRAVQAPGLECNSERRYPLVRDSNGYINLPSNTLQVYRHWKYDDVVQRGSRLYDKEHHTFVFTKDVEVDIVFFLDFKDLPEIIRHYIALRAARTYQKRHMASDTLEGYARADEERAWAKVYAEELRASQVNIMDSDNVFKIMIRR